jgi:hypothetical protein
VSVVAGNNKIFEDTAALPRILHDREEPRKIDNFSVWISAVDYTREVEEVSALVKLGP